MALTVQEYAQLSAASYKKDPKNKIKTDNFDNINKEINEGENQPLAFANDDPKTGFSANVYRKNNSNEIVIAFTGTNLTLGENGEDSTTFSLPNTDFSQANIPNATGYLSKPFKQAIDLTLAVIRKKSGANITFTGHSMGGGLASLMAIFFNKPAYVFDPAPFEKTATLNPVIKHESIVGPSRQWYDYLDKWDKFLNEYAENHAAPDFRQYKDSILDYIHGKVNRSQFLNLFQEREKNVQSWHIKGEALEGLREHLPAIIGSETVIDIGKQSASSVDLHSIALLQATLLSEKLKNALSSSPYAVEMMMNDQLYAIPDSHKNETTDFLIGLVNQHIGKNDKDTDNEHIPVLNYFADDLEKLSQIATGINQQKAILAQMIEWYHHEIKEFKFGQNGVSFFTKPTDGVLQYTPLQTANRAQSFVKNWLSQVYSKNLVDRYEEIQASIGLGPKFPVPNFGDDFSDDKYINKEQWTVAAISAAGNAVALNANKTQLMMGGSLGDQFTGGNQDDALIGGLGADVLRGGAGNDELVAGIAKVEVSSSYVGSSYDSSSNQLYGGLGQDTLYGSWGDDFLYGGNDQEGVDDESRDTIYGSIGKDTIYGGAGDDQLYGANDEKGIDDEHTDRIYGGLGKDTIYGGAGDDGLYGANDQEGDDDNNTDIIYGGKGQDTIYGGAGNDKLYAGQSENGDSDASSNFLKGGQGRDELYGDDGYDQLYGDDGNDTLKGNGGADMLHGGKGHDTYIADHKDIIFDEDGMGSVQLGGKKLTGGERDPETDPENTYYGYDGTEYVINGSDLIINGSLTIQYYEQGDLGIQLTYKEKDTPPPQPDPSKTPVPRDPLAIDLNGDGIVASIGIKNSKAYFDIDNDDLAEKMGWIAPEDGLVVRDVNGDGQINHQGELFGRLDKNGFEVLAEFDDNRDGKITDLDGIYAELKIWQDKNSNGLTESGELISFIDANITEFNLTHQVSEMDSNGNTIIAQGDFVRDGQKSEAVAFNFLVDNGITKDKETHTVDVSSLEKLHQQGIFLPVLRGFGRIKDLHSVYSINPFLQNLVQELSKASASDLLNQFDTLLAEWSGLNQWRNQANVDATAVLTVQDKLWILEQFSDQRQFSSAIEAEYQSGKASGIQVNSNYIQSLFDQFRLHYLERFAVQGILSDAFKGTHYSLSSNQIVLDKGRTLRLSLSDYFVSNKVDDVTALLITQIYHDHKSVFHINQSELIKIFSAANHDNILYRYLTENLSVSFGVGSSLFTGLNGQSNYILSAPNQASVLGGNGNDWIKSNIGRDVLNGGSGSDTYIFGKNFGQDTINNYDQSNYRQDTILLTKNWKQSDFTYRRKNNHLLISSIESDDQITVLNYFNHDANGGYQIDWIAFDDGTKLDIETVKALVQQNTDGDDHLYAYSSGDSLSGGEGSDTLYGATGSDILYGNEGDDHIRGESGNDTLYGGTGDDNLYGEDGNDILNGGEGNDNLHGEDGNDILDGGEGDDKLYGYDGNDTLIAGLGNDHLQGNNGSDTYILGRSFGQDTINNYDQSNYRQDTILLTENWKQSDFTYRRKDNHLLISSVESDDQITVLNYFNHDANGGYQIDWIAFDDGTKLNIETVKALVQQNTDGDDILYAYNSGSLLSGRKGNDHLKGESGNDRLDGGEDNDRLYGNNGNDILIGGMGNDYLSGDEGSDTYVFGKNFGHDTIINYHLAGQEDTIQFADGWKQSDFAYRRKDYDLLISSIHTNDQIVVKNYFLNDFFRGNYQTDWITFDDGTKLDVETVKLLVQKSTDGDDHLYAYTTGSLLSGGKGADILDGSLGVDHLYGNEGNDKLYGGEANDILTGGEGNDTLNGYTGKDTYVFSDNFGQDTIIEVDGNNSIRFERIHSNEVKLYRSNNDLIIQQIGTDNQITVRNEFHDKTENGRFYTQSQYIDQIVFNDGVIWNQDKIKQLVVIGNDEDETITGLHDDDVIMGNGGNDNLKGQVGQDTYVFAPNFGQDNIIEVDANNSIRFEGIRSDELKLYRDGSDLIIKQIGTNNQINVRYQFIDQYHDTHLHTAIKYITQIIFDDGVIWDTTKIKQLTVTGNDENDTLWGFYDDDRIIGNGGNDSLNGLVGQDTYVFSPNWGQDIIHDTDANSILLFNHIKPSDIRLIREGNSLIVIRADSNDRITIAEHFKNETEYTTHNRITQIIFDDGTVWDTVKIKQQILTGTDADEVLHNPFIEGGTLYGVSGNDRLYGGKQQDILLGGGGNDELLGHTGNDTLIGGEGNDVLNGGLDSDTFVFAKEWGQDTIQAENNKFDQDIDTIVFTDVQANEVSLRHEYGSLILKRLNSDDQIEVRGQFSTVPTINQITFADGTTWSTQDIYLNALRGTDAADTITAIDATDEIHGGFGDDVLHGISWDGQNRLFGEAGQDTLTGSGLLDGGEGNDIITGSGTLLGGEGNDTLTLDWSLAALSSSSTILDGGVGNDILDATRINHFFGENGAAYITPTAPDTSSPDYRAYILRGGKGNDTIYGSTEHDVYEFDLGDGHDIVIERKLDEAWTNTYASYDVIQMGSGIAVHDIEFLRQGNDLILRHHNGTDSITVKEHFNTFNAAANHYKIDELRFTDGTILTHAQIDEKAIYSGSAGADQLMGYRDINDSIKAAAGDDQVFGQKGHDVLYGEAGQDYLDGGEGDDRLLGGIGNDNLVGGLGNDVLDGGAGNDTYLYRANSGQDVIDQTGGGTDTLFFMDGITREQLGFIREGNDLLITVNKDQQQSVRVKDHFLGGEKAISRVGPNGGLMISATEINRLLGKNSTTTTPTQPSPPAQSNPPTQPTGSGYSKTIKGTARNDTKLTGSTGNDWIEGLAGNDTLTGMAGNDMLIGGTGNDTYVFKKGFGQDIIDNTGGGSDRIYFEGITFNQVGSGLTRMNDDLILKVSGTSDQVTLNNWFKGGEYVIQSIEFASGGKMTSSQIFKAFGLQDLTSITRASRSANTTLTSGTERMIQAMSAFGVPDQALGADDAHQRAGHSMHMLSHLAVTSI